MPISIKYIHHTRSPSHHPPTITLARVWMWIWVQPFQHLLCARDRAKRFHGPLLPTYAVRSLTPDTVTWKIGGDHRRWCKNSNGAWNAALSLRCAFGTSAVNQSAPLRPRQVLRLASHLAPSSVRPPGRDRSNWPYNWRVLSADYPAPST